jgi:HK97 gp10 family phage protein
MPRGQTSYSTDLVDPELIASDLLQATMRAATRVVAKAARSNAPKRSGALRKSIRATVRQKGKNAAVAAKAPHAHLVHDGTKAHVIKAKNGKALKLGPFTYITGAVNHPGAKAQPFLMDAAEQSRGSVEAAIRNIIDQAAAGGDE